MMRNLKICVLALALIFGTSMFAGTTKDSNKPYAVVEQVSRLLKHHEFKLQEDVSLEVIVTVNKDNELVGLSVDPKNYNLKNLILEKLNYKKVEGAVDTLIKEYKIPGRIET